MEEHEPITCAFMRRQLHEYKEKISRAASRVQLYANVLRDRLIILRELERSADHGPLEDRVVAMERAERCVVPFLRLLRVLDGTDGLTGCDMENELEATMQAFLSDVRVPPRHERPTHGDANLSNSSSSTKRFRPQFQSLVSDAGGDAEEDSSVTPKHTYVGGGADGPRMRLTPSKGKIRLFT